MNGFSDAGSIPAASKFGQANALFPSKARGCAQSARSLGFFWGEARQGGHQKFEIQIAHRRRAFSKIHQTSPRIMNRQNPPAAAQKIFQAVCEGNLNAVIQIVAESTDINALCLKGRQTLLMEAINLGHLDIAAFLIKSGANITPLENHDANPLYHASQKGHDSLVRLLIDFGAYMEKYGWHALRSAIENGLIHCQNSRGRRCRHQ